MLFGSAHLLSNSFPSSFSVFVKLSSSLVLHSQRFGRYILRHLSGVSRTYVKGLAEKIQKYVVHITSGQYSQVAPLLRWYLFRVKPRVYKGEICHPLKVRQEEHRKAVIWGEIEKSGMMDHIWKEKESHLPFWDEVKINW